MLHVGFVTTSYPLSEKSNSGIFTKKLADALIKQGCNVTIVTPADSSTNSKKLTKNILLIKYAPSFLRKLCHNPGGIPAALKQNKLNYFLIPFLLAGIFLLSIKVAKQVDIIHANWAINGLLCGISAFILRKPCITTVRGEDINQITESKIHYLVVLLCLQLSSKVVCVSKNILNKLVNNYPKYSNKLVCIHNGIDNSFFQPLKLINTSNKIQLLTVSSLTNLKQINIILEAISLTKKNIFLTIVGSGPEEKNLKLLCKKLNIESKVKFEGAVKNDQLPSYYKRADIFILASKREGRPNVILEAFASGKVVVANKTAGIEDIITNNKNGILFKYNSAEDLNNKIDFIISNKKIAHTLQKNAVSYLKKKRLNWANTADQYISLYRQLCAV
ncbi:glycosyltransferase family 4 protein [Zooshikella marina]|uniref:glycosyltransferase family 4 protein n=1 Tax=Zooshikella ganghwensis TaxID=202772 RepID=UPI001BAF1EBC|nr:glycosyltransferase family 4 protein [Zooshikella ganghwensis]MBU2707295.1 glycosyltransferase family 4 protein [Zooshikella ganghwensis]